MSNRNLKHHRAKVEIRPGLLPLTPKPLPMQLNVLTNAIHLFSLLKTKYPSHPQILFFSYSPHPVHQQIQCPFSKYIQNLTTVIPLTTSTILIQTTTTSSLSSHKIPHLVLLLLPLSVSIQSNLSKCQQDNAMPPLKASQQLPSTK